MEYANTNMGGGQQNYVPHSQDIPRVSAGCNPQHPVNNFSGTDCATPNRNYGPYTQAYHSPHDYTGPHNVHIGSPVYQQPYSTENHSQSLTLNQLLQQGNNSSTYQMRSMQNPQAPFRNYDPYGYSYKPGIPTCVAQERPAATTYPYPGPQRYNDPYVRSPYSPYPPGPNYPYYHSQSMPQRPRISQSISGLEYNNMNSSAQPRPPQPTTPGSNSNLPERPSSRNVNFLNTSSQSSSPTVQLSSPLYNSGGGTQPSSWSPHSLPFGSPQHLTHGQAQQSQSRPRSISRDYQLKSTPEVTSESPSGGNIANSNNNNSTSGSRSDGPTENISNMIEESGSRPQSRLSETSSSAVVNSHSANLKDQSESQIPTSSLENLINSTNTDPIQPPITCITINSTSNSSASPIPVVSHGNQTSQSFSSFNQQTTSVSSATTLSQTNSGPSQTIPCMSPVQSKLISQSRQTPPLPRPYGVSSHDSGGPRMTYSPYPQPQLQQPHHNNLYVMGSRPGFYPGNYPMRPGSMQPMVCTSGPMPGRPQFQPQSVSTGSMPPPAAPPTSVSAPNPTIGCVTNGSSQPNIGTGSSYSISHSGGAYGPNGITHTVHPSWDQDSSSPLPPYQAVPNSTQQQFGGRPCPPYSGQVERGMGYPPSPNTQGPTSGLISHNGQHMQSPMPGSYSQNQPPGYPNHPHPQYLYPSSQIPYHTQSPYQHPYAPGSIPIVSPQSHSQHIQPSTSSVAPPYPTSMIQTASGSSIPPHLQVNREPYHSQYPHEMLQQSVSSANENFTSSGFPVHPPSGSPNNLRPSSTNSTSTNSITNTSNNNNNNNGSNNSTGNNNNNGALPKTSSLSGKPGKVDNLTRSMTPSTSCNAPISSPSQTNVGPSDSNVNLPSQRLPQSGHPQMQQYSGSASYPPGTGPLSSFTSMSSGTGSPNQGSFPGFQQQYRPPTSQNPIQHPHNLPNSINVQCSAPAYPSIPGQPEASSPHSVSNQSMSGFHKLLELGNEPERRPWLEHYIRFMEEIGKPIIGLPQVVKQPLDIYRFYLAVRERGGVIDVIKSRKWKEISQVINIHASASAAYTLRKNYCKYLLEYECRFDRGGIDPRPLLAHIEALSIKKKKGMLSGDGDSNSLIGGFPPPAPPSPCGSHSSASSSLLPPGSSGASLSGGPSGTAGSAASDSQLGPPSSQQQRFSDQGQPGSVSTVPESPNGIPNVSSPAVLSGQSIQSSGPTPNNVSSPQCSSSGTVINGYLNTSYSVSDPSTCSSSSWPWNPEMGSSDSNIPRQTASTDSSVTRPSSPPTLESFSSQGFQGRVQPPVSSGAPLSTSVSSSTVMPLSAPIPSSVCVPSSVGPDLALHQNTNPYPSSINHIPPGIQHGVVNHTHVHTSIDHAFQGSQSSAHPRITGQSFRPPSFNTGPPMGVNGDSVTLFRMHQLRQTTPSQMPPYPPGVVSPFCSTSVVNNISNNANVVPAHLIHHHGQRPGYVATILKRFDHYTFPPGSVEATPIDSPRRRRYRAKDLGQIAPFKLLMALRSGLTAEISWALNCLNVLLRDDNGLDCISPNTLPGLLTSLVEIWRHTLGELFDHNLFVTSLELPTDLSILSNSGPDIELFDSDNDGKEMVHKNVDQKYLKPPSLNDIHYKSYSSDVCLNALIKLERDISKVVSSKGLSLSSVRAGIRRLLRRNNNNDSSISGKHPVRLRNGLMFRLDNLSSLTTTTPVSSIISTSLTDSCSTPTSSIMPRSRKRGKQLSSTTYTCASSGLITSGSIGSNEFYTGLSNNLNNSAITNKHDGILTLTTVPQTTIVNNFRSPEAFSNLRDLALYVIDSLVSQNKNDSLKSMDECNNNNDNQQSIDNQKIIKSNYIYTSKSTKLLRLMLQKGGGDTTCHIMPPFGACAYPSTHWMNNIENFEIDNSHLLPNLREHSQTLSSISKSSNIAKDKLPNQSTNNDNNNKFVRQETEIEIEAEEEEQPPAKRIRHASSSSLSCPILSPQPLDEMSDETDTKSQNNQDKDINNQKSNSNIVEESEEEIEFSQLIMDENGRCPLRAREELVSLGGICLWPNHKDTDSNEARAVRCLCVSTVLRNLSFIGLAERHLSTQKGVLALIGRLILLGHDHVGPSDSWQTVEQKSQTMEPSWCAWWTPTWLEDMRENALVLLVNVAGYLELVNFDESIVRPILEGLLHWITCSTAASIDPFPGHRTLSPRRLALEALNRLCVHETNVDLLLSTPSDITVLSRLFDRLAHWLALPEDQVTRELALSTMHYLAGGGASFTSPSITASMGKVILNDTAFNLPTSYIGTTMLANAKPSPVAGLLAFIEAAESTTRRVIDQCGVQALQERPELMGTSLEMVRRAGALLDRLAIDPRGRKSFTPDLELRLMDLVTSRVLDATVAHLLCGALYHLLPEEQFIEVDVKPTVPPIPSLSVVAQLLKQPSNNLENQVTDIVKDQETCQQLSKSAFVKSPPIISTDQHECDKETEVDKTSNSVQNVDVKSEETDSNNPSDEIPISDKQDPNNNSKNTLNIDETSLKMNPLNESVDKSPTNINSKTEGNSVCVTSLNDFNNNDITATLSTTISTTTTTPPDDHTTTNNNNSSFPHSFSTEPSQPKTNCVDL